MDNMDNEYEELYNFACEKIKKNAQIQYETSTKLNELESRIDHWNYENSKIFWWQFWRSNKTFKDIYKSDWFKIKE